MRLLRQSLCLTVEGERSVGSVFDNLFGAAIQTIFTIILGSQGNISSGVCLKANEESNPVASYLHGHPGKPRHHLRGSEDLLVVDVRREVEVLVGVCNHRDLGGVWCCFHCINSHSTLSEDGLGTELP